MIPAFEKPIFVTQPYLPPLEEFCTSLQEIWQNKWLTNNGPIVTRYQDRLRTLDRTFPGAGRLIDGAQRKGVFSAALVSLATVAIALGGAPLHDPWATSSEGFFTAPRIAGFVLLLLLYFAYNAVRIPMRNRHLQPHPSSSVSFAGLIETRRAGAGG